MRGLFEDLVSEQRDICRVGQLAGKAAIGML
jgi:hypothetical protein